MNHQLIILLLLATLAACRSRGLEVDLPNPPEPSLSVAKAPTLLVQPTGDTLRQPLRLAEMEVDLEALLGAVRVTLDLIYENAYDEELAGTFFFPLAGGLTVDSFALEVKGQLRPAVIVPRVRGRQVYEQIKREGIDPALLEWQRGQAFRAQVYPIPAGGRKRIRLAFTAPMQYEQGLWSYQLPLRTETALDQLRLQVRLPSALAATLTLQPAQARPPLLLPFTSVAKGFVCDTTLETFLTNHQLQLRYQPRQASPTTPEWLSYADAAGNTWFATQVFIPPTASSAPAPKRIALLWDISHSTAQRKLPQEAAILAAYLRNLGEVEVLLLPFRHRPLPVERFRIAGGNSADLLSRLQRFRYDGATNLGALNLSDLSVDEVILASDGVATWQEPGFTPGDTRLHVLTSGPQADLRYLRALARQQGGFLIQADAGRGPDQWAKLLRQPAPRLRAEAGQSELNPLLSPLPGQPWLITGRLRGERDTLILRDATGREQQRILLERTQPGQVSDLPRRLWAQQRLEALLAQPATPREEIIALAQAQGLVTPYTSLLVLDRVEDYVRFDVPAPPELAQAVAAARARQQEETRFELLSHIDQVAEDFALRVDWWQTDFEIPEEPYQPPTIKKGEVEPGLADPFDSPTSGQTSGSLDDIGATDAGPDEPFDAEEKSEASDPTENDTEPGAPAVEIELEPWRSGLPYQAQLEAAAEDSLEAVYFGLKATYGQLPAFYADAASLCVARGEAELGLRVLSNLAELEPDNVALLRVLGYRLQQLDSLALASWVLGKVLSLRPDEPQSHRDLGLVLAKQDSLQQAIERLYEVVRQPWNDRFPGIGVLVAHEINSLIGQTRRPLDLRFVDERLLKAMPTDLRVVLSWDANDVDLDLWVIDPRGEKCYYQNRQTQIGGLMSRDFTGGYGPEEFLLKAAMPGRYQVQANYYANKQASLTGPATLRLRLIRHYGRPNQEEKRMVLRLGEENEVVSVGTFEVAE